MDGKHEGLWTWWYESGKKKSEVTYMKGEEKSQKSWDEKGKQIKTHKSKEVESYDSIIKKKGYDIPD